MRLPGQDSVKTALAADYFILKDSTGKILQEQMMVRDNVFVFFYTEGKFYGLVSLPFVVITKVRFCSEHGLLYKI
jgi:hypothetical protein